MIRKEHFNDDGFDCTKFLVDLNYGKDIFRKEYHLVVKEAEEYIKLISEFLKSKRFFNQLYDQFYTLSIYKFNNEKSELNIRYTQDFNISKFDEFIKQYLYIKSEKILPKIKLLSIINNIPKLTSNTLKKEIVIDIKNSYNLSYPLESIIKDIKSDNSGLILFTGLPGTGKTTLIKYLSQIYQDLDFVFINNSNIRLLTDPSFIDFALTNMSNSIIILEDCEKALLDRSINNSYDISSLLNLTDGLLSDILNIKIIATLNTADKIDTALLRKGRLISRSDFGKLSVEQANNIAISLNKNVKITEPTVLTEIYNSEDNGVEVVKKELVGYKF